MIPLNLATSEKSVLEVRLKIDPDCRAIGRRSAAAKVARLCSSDARGLARHFVIGPMYDFFIADAIVERKYLEAVLADLTRLLGSLRAYRAIAPAVVCTDASDAIQALQSLREEFATKLAEVQEEIERNLQ